MHLDVQITSCSIPSHLPPPPAPNLGAWVEFRGIVRGEEDGQPIAALEYEAYQPMAERQMKRILTGLAATQPCLAAHVLHRVGVVPVGDTAIWIGIAAHHRAAAFAVAAAFMDRLKLDVPIWKCRAIPRPLAPEPGDLPVATRSPPTSEASTSAVVTLVRGACSPLAAESVTLADADGRVLHEAVCAREDQPPFDRSAVDGYAVRIDDTGSRFRIVDQLRAGDWKPRSLHPGETVRIATGAALPGDGLQVVMREDVTVSGDVVEVLRRGTDRHLRFRGEDARAGQALVPSGTVLQPGSLSLLASLGCTAPRVARLPRVLHLATGNELVPPDLTPGPGQIRDCNSTLVQAFFRQWSITPRQQRLPEDETSVHAALAAVDDAIDLLLISGGASVGEHDFTRRLLEAQGFSVLVSRTAARPGRPLIVAQRGPTLAFGLPGNPLAHFVCLNLYVRAALEAWSGQSVFSTFQQGTLATALPARQSAGELCWPARLSSASGRVELAPLRWSSSGDLTGLATANALLRVPADRTHDAGSTIEFLRTDRFP